MAVSAVITAAVLKITGGNTDDAVAVRLKPGDPTVVQVDVNNDGTAEFSFARALFDRVSLLGNGGNDLMIVDEVNGAIADKPVVLKGGAGNDTLVSGSGNDSLYGEAGDDSLCGGAGDDFYDFDADLALGSDTVAEPANGGSDTLNFSLTTLTGVVVDLGSAATQAVNVRLNLTLSGEVEDVTGGGAADVLIGNALANRFIGNNGGDTLAAGAGGDDTLDGGSSLSYYDIADGAGPEDTLISIEGQTGQATLSGTALLVVGTFQADTIVLRINAINPDWLDVDYGDDGVAEFSFARSASATVTVLGCDGDDRLMLDESNGQIVGENVSLRGDLGDDTLIGGSGVDWLAGGPGDDSLVGGAGGDTYPYHGDFSLGTDTIDEEPGGPTGFAAGDFLDFSTTSTTAIALDLSTTAVQQVTPGIAIRLTSGESIERAVGGPKADRLTGNALANTLNGGDGDDTLIGLAGDDRYVTNYLSGATKQETLTIVEAPGEGRDVLDVSPNTNVGVALDLAVAGPQVLNACLTLDLSSGEAIEDVWGTALADTIAGNGLANALLGNGGDDTLSGGDGDDTLDGGAGTDEGHGGAGNDTFTAIETIVDP